MQFKTLGDTGLLVSRLCFGCMTFHGGSGIWNHIGKVDQPTAEALVRRSIEAGINFFDTADIYSDGESEAMLGRAFKHLNVPRKDVVIATKVFGRTGLGRNDIGASRAHVLTAVEDSLRRLGTDYIDLYQIHGNDSITPLEETLRALETLVQNGKVRYVGASNWEAWKLSRAVTISEHTGWARLDTFQAFYSLAARDIEREFLPMFRHTRTGLLVYSPLAGGLLSGKFGRAAPTPEDSRRSTFNFPLVDQDRAWRILDVLRPIAERYACSPARVALGWLLHQPLVTSVILGAKRLDQLDDNLASVHLELSSQDLDLLDQVSELPPEYPAWILPFQNASRLDPDAPRPDSRANSRAELRSV